MRRLRMLPEQFGRVQGDAFGLQLRVVAHRAALVDDLFYLGKTSRLTRSGHCGGRLRRRGRRHPNGQPDQQHRAQLGTFPGRAFVLNIRRLVLDHGGFDYDSDCCGDDLPFWLNVEKTNGSLAAQRVVPYALDTNDMRFALPKGFSQGDDFFIYLRGSFDVLFAQGEERPAMLSIGMHCRPLDRPGRLRELQRFLDQINKHHRVWIARRIDIARHWKMAHPFNLETAFVWAAA